MLVLVLVLVLVLMPEEGVSVRGEVHKGPGENDKVQIDRHVLLEVGICDAVLQKNTSRTNAFFQIPSRILEGAIYRPPHPVKPSRVRLWLRL